MREHLRLPHRFALAVDPSIRFVYHIEKIVIENQEFRDVSKLYGEYPDDGEIRVEDTHPPLFSTEIIVCNGSQIEIEFCITPLLFLSDSRRPYPVVIIKNFHRIQRFLRTPPSNVTRIVPQVHEWRVHDLLRFLFEDMENRNPRDYDFNRRWPNGLRNYPDQFNYDFNFRRLSRYTYTYDDEEEYTPEPTPRATPTPRQEEPAPKPTLPAERVALALARDSIAQGEVCPITQDKLQATKIGVTGCLCVFQGEAIESYKGTTCPSCRTPLTVRYVVLANGKNPNDDLSKLSQQPVNC
jgi:hypothetical protein